MSESSVEGVVFSEDDMTQLKSGIAAEVKRWRFAEFPSGAAAAAFANLPPAQGAGELSCAQLNNGRFGLFYFL